MVKRVQVSKRNYNSPVREGKYVPLLGLFRSCTMVNSSVLALETDLLFAEV